MKFQTNYDVEPVRGEWYEPGTSETEEGQEVSIKSVYERCLRGEMVPEGRNFYYEDEVGILEHPDSDIADLTVISDYLASKTKTDNEEAKSKDGAVPIKQAPDEKNFADEAVKESPKD
jgi:hypothetical protein